MRLFLKVVLAIFAIFIAIILIGSLMLDKSYDVSRSETIEGPPEAIHAYVGELKTWDEWTVFAAEDPDLKISYGDQTSGVGGKYAWTGQGMDGSLTYTKSDPKSGVEYDMTIKSGGTEYPTAKGLVSYEPSADGKTTKVTWRMHSELEGIMAGWLALGMDKGIGDLFSANLKQLKEKVEAQQAPKAGNKTEGN